MLDPKLIAEMDQALQGLAEAFPPLLWAFFGSLQQQGFSDVAALQLTGILLHSLITKPTSGLGE